MKQERIVSNADMAYSQDEYYNDPPIRGLNDKSRKG